MTAHRPHRRAVLVAVGVTALVVVGCLAFLWQRTDPAEGVARNYLKALATGDGQLACTLMTEPFRQEIATRYEVSGCPEGVDRMLGGLSGEQREKVGDARLSTTGTTGWLEVGANPLGITILRVDRSGDEWMVTGDR